MARRYVERIQSAAHGLMELEGLETAVLDVLRTREVQRLRRIRQLGLAYFVFPDAEHSRFVHALGAAYLATRFVRQLAGEAADVVSTELQPDAGAARDLALAALFHDLGHGPLSHAWEAEVVEDFAVPAKRAAWLHALGLPDDVSATKWHEAVAQALITWEGGELHRLLERQERGTAERLRRLLDGQHYLPYLPRLLASDVDVDRCDYIVRDFMMTGVVDRFDSERLLSTLTLGIHSTGLVAGFDGKKAPSVIARLLEARRTLYQTVVHHRTVQSAEVMVGLLLRRLKFLCGEDEEHWPIEMEGAIAAPFQAILQGRELSPSQILGLDDYTLWNLITAAAHEKTRDRTLQDLARRLVTRDLFKEVPVDQGQLARFERPETKGKIRDIVSRNFPDFDPDYVVVSARRSFTVVSGPDTPDTVYLVNRDSRDRKAAPAIADPVLAPYHTGREEEVKRIFAPALIRDDVAAVL